ncbi:MAG: hypothetical protein ACJ71A_01320 [Nitrososphaeraceae archaeon]|jgi:hypothetical protein
MNSGKLVIVVIPSIIALIFSVFVTIGIIADVADRAERDKQLKHKLDNVVVLTPSAPLSSSPNPKVSSPLSPQITQMNLPHYYLIHKNAEVRFLECTFF